MSAAVDDPELVRSLPGADAPAAAAAGDAPGVLTLVGQLVRFALPATLIMLLSGLSLVVDTYFVTGLGSEALAGVSLVFPLYLFLVMAFGGGIGVGLSVVLSVRLGRGDLAGARRAVGSALALALALSALFVVGFALGGRALFERVAGTAGIVDAAMDFARPIFFGSPVVAVSLTLSNVLRSEKRVKEAAAMLLLSGAVNAALAPVLIYGRAGAPALGVAGAGVATVIGFAVSALLGVALLRRGGRLSLRLTELRVAPADARAIVKIALPTLGTYVATNSVLMALSSVWAGLGTDALASYGLATRLEYLIALAIYGVGAAIVTLGGEAWGAGRSREMARICALCAGGVFAVTCALALALIASPASWFELFDAPPAVVAAGARYLPIAALGYPFYAVALTLNYAYQTIERAHLPLLWSLSRGFVIAVPAAAITIGAGGSIGAAAVGVAASLVALGAVTVGSWPRSLARAEAARRPRRPPLTRAEIEHDGGLPQLAAVKASGLAVSPYPLGYTLRWPWYFRRPSTRNHTGMATLPTRFARPDAGPTVRVCAVGDIMVMQRDRVPVLAPELTSLLSSADLIVGTCEAAMARADRDPRAEHHFMFNMPAAYLRGIIAQSGAPPDRWYLSMANNHAGDVGPDGALATVRYLRSLGVQPLGARRAGEPPFAIAEVRGLCVGVAAWTHWLNLPEDRVWRTADVAAMPWRALRAEHGVDSLIGSAHWEYEWQHFPRAETRAMARQLAGAGFDLVIGSHPHCLQPFEWIDGALCAYSLGNFCSGLGPSWSARMCSVAVIELGTLGAQRGKVVGYELRSFVQLDDGERVSLVPLDRAPAPLQGRVRGRVATVFAA